MSDRMSTQIEIGGQISRSTPYPDEPEDMLLEHLMGEIISEGVQLEYGEEEVENFDDEQALLEDVNESGYLQYRHDQKTNGYFEQLEDWLREHGIPYRRWCESKYEYPGEDVYWNPGMKKPLVLYCDGDTDETVKGDKVRDAMDELDEAASLDGNERNRLIERARMLLHELCPEIPKNMPKFEIVA